MSSNVSIPLAPGPVILTLGSWAQQHLTEVYTATTQSAFVSAFDAFVAPRAAITVNGAAESRDAYQQLLFAQELDPSKSVHFISLTALPSGPNDWLDIDYVTVATGNACASEPNRASSRC